MKSQKNFLNLLGQIRIYSLIDFILLLIAINSDKYQLAGAILLHLSFLLFLEENHNHPYRNKFPKYSWIIFLIIGFIFLHNFAILLFIIFSFFYTKKNIKIIGPFSPFIRGLQSYFIVASIAGFSSPVSYSAFCLLTIRNFAGDIRDIDKDKKSGMQTLPIILGIKGEFRYIHLILLLLTTTVWWIIADISITWLALIFIIQILTYNITPR